MSRTIPRVELRLFGQGTISADGAPVKLAKRATTLALLGYLVLHRKAPVSRTTLAYTLFPDQTDENAFAELRRYLYLAGKSLPAIDDQNWILADAETVQWNAKAPFTVDVIDFERAAGDPAAREHAVELYAGDLLEELYDDWVVGERERLRALFLDALAHLVSKYREARDHSRALGYAHTLLRFDPWREDMVRAAMSVRYEAGDSAGATAEFIHFASRLRGEMNVAPMPETLAIRDAIARNEPIPGAVLNRVTLASERAARPEHLLPFVGRSAQIEILRALWDRAARGRGGFALVAGEAGIGKTRLVGELARIVESEGGRVFVGGTSVQESMPYQSIIEALRSSLQLLRTRSFSQIVTSALSRLLPELQAQSPAVASAHEELPPDAGVLWDALATASLQLCRPRPALVVLEDLHWAGHATFEAIATLARRLERFGLLLVGTYREEEVPPSHPLRTMARALHAEQLLVTIPLTLLDRPAIEKLVSELNLHPGNDALFVDRLVKYTEGNALFLNEAIAEVLDRKSAVDSIFEAVNPRIEDAIARRLARLGERAREVAEIIAVAGQGCNLEVVSEVAAMPPSDLWNAINELLDRRILREASARTGTDYAFAHHLIGATVYDRVDPLVRKRRHARIAHVLQRMYAARPNAVSRELAAHFERAGLFDEAAQWYGEAAAASAAVHAPKDAVALTTRALELERDVQRRISLLRLREEARSRIGDRAGQRADIEMLEQSVGAADLNTRFDLIRRRALLARSLGNAAEDEALIEQMLSLADDASDERLRAESLRQRATHAVFVSRQMEALEPAAEALVLFERLGDVAAQVECLGLLVDAETNSGNLGGARIHLDAMGQRAATLEDRALHARALTVAGTAALLRQEYRTAQEISLEVLSIATAIGDPDLEAYARARIAASAVWLGDLDRALTEFTAARDIFTALSNKRGLAIALTNQVQVNIRLGLFEEALAMIEQANSLLDVVKERRIVVANSVNRSFILLRVGDAEEALRQAEKALVDAREIGFPVFEAAALANIGNAERALGRLDDAIAHMRAGIDIRRAVQATPDFADDLSDLAIALADAGRGDEACCVSEELAATLEQTTTGPLWAHYAYWAASRGFAAAGESRRAADFQQLAQDRLRHFADSIKDEEIRKAFLAIDISREILRAN
ncbi:MAG TPA: AAA family ATPase [Candidatus Baltobacteraceae bacterium]|nr:AAA family ATPase [Candidatus Baltobacteraceae bacterium]